MKLEYFSVTLLFLVIGYLIGSISWATILSKKVKSQDVRKVGSKNAGATNTLRNYGKKLGLIVFILDVLKPVTATIIAYMIKTYGGYPWDHGLVQVASLATIIGHIFPVFFQFRGGKGAACFAGVALSMQWILFIIGFIIFIVIVKLTKKVSLGSIFGSFSLVIINLIFGFITAMNQTWANPMTQDPTWWTNTIVLAIGWIIVVLKHHENIKRLICGEERTLNLKNK